MPKIVFGYCPVCGDPGKMREKHPGGDDVCESGHRYPSSTSVTYTNVEYIVTGYNGGSIPGRLGGENEATIDATCLGSTKELTQAIKMHKDLQFFHEYDYSEILLEVTYD